MLKTKKTLYDFPRSKISYEAGRMKPQSGEGFILSYDELVLYLSPTTAENLAIISTMFGIIWKTAYVFIIDQEKRGMRARETVKRASILVEGKDCEGRTRQFFRKETFAPDAGQTYLYTEGCCPRKIGELREIIRIVEKVERNGEKLEKLLTHEKMEVRRLVKEKLARK